MWPQYSSRSYTFVSWCLVLFTIGLIDASQLFFTSSDQCAQVTAHFNSPALSTTTEFLARATLELSSNTGQENNLNTLPLGCPTTTGASATTSTILGVNTFDVTGSRLFEIIQTGSIFTNGAYQFSSAIRMTTYASQTPVVSQLTLAGTAGVLLIQYHPTTNQLLAITRNGPTVLLQSFDISSSTSSSAANTLLDLSSSLGQSLIVDGLSALDVTGNRLMILTNTIANGISPTTTFSLITIDLINPSMTLPHSFGVGIASVEGMSWLPNLGECLLVSFDAAFRFNPSTQVLTPITSVASALSSISSAAAAPASSLQALVYLSTHLWYAANTLSSDVSATTVPYSSLVPTGLVSMIVQASTTIQPLLLLVDAANNECHIDSLPRTAGGTITGTTSQASQTKLVSLHTYALTPNITGYLPSTFSGTGGAITVTGANFFSLNGLISSIPICRFGSQFTAVATVINSTTLTCTVPSNSVSLLEFEVQFTNETVSTSPIDINQCLVNNGGCHSPALCIHTYGSNSCSFSSCSNSSSSGCTCLAGYTSATQTIAHCDACLVATYKPTQSFDACTKCPTYATAPAASTAATDCSCLSTFTETDGSCVMAPISSSATLSVLVTFSVQSNWQSIPDPNLVGLKGQQPFKDGIIADLAQALGVSVSRFSVDSLALDTTANATLAAGGSGGIYVVVSVSILPSTGADSSLDSNGDPYSPTQLEQILELLAANSQSALYTGTYTKTIRASSLTAVAETEPSVSWPYTSTGTAVIFSLVVLVLILIVGGLFYASPSEARPLDLATALLAITSTVTNFNFIIYLQNNRSKYDFTAAYYATIFFFSIPLVVNCIVVIHGLIELNTRKKASGDKKLEVFEPCGVVKGHKDLWTKYKESHHFQTGHVNEDDATPSTFHDWMTDNVPSTILIVLLSILSIDCLALLTCQILWRKEFSAPWSAGKTWVTERGLVGVIIRDLPQLIIQVVVTQHTHTWSSLQTLSVISSGASVFFGLLVRGVTFLLNRNSTAISSQKAKRDEVARGKSDLSPEFAERHRLHQAIINGGVPKTHAADIELTQPTAHYLSQSSTAAVGPDSPIGSPSANQVNSYSPPPPIPVRPSRSTIDNLHIRISPQVMVISLCVVSIFMSGPIQVHGSLSTNANGHILSAPLQVYGNVTVVESDGGKQNLLELILQQSQMLTQQSTLIQQQATLLQILNSTVQDQLIVNQQQANLIQQQQSLLNLHQNNLLYANQTIQQQSALLTQFSSTMWSSGSLGSSGSYRLESFIIGGVGADVTGPTSGGAWIASSVRNAQGDWTITFNTGTFGALIHVAVSPQTDNPDGHTIYSASVLDFSQNHVRIVTRYIQSSVGNPAYVTSSDLGVFVHIFGIRG